MILINLLPEEFRVKEKKTQEIPALKIAIIVGVLFALLTVGFYVDFLFAKVRLSKLEANWSGLQPRSLQLSKLEKEVEGTLKPEKEFLERFAATKKPLTYFMLWTSELLPDTAWLTEFKREVKSDGTDDFFIKGLAMASKEKSSIEQIEMYLHHLQEKLPGASLSLTTTRQRIEAVELTQFIADFKLGSKK